MPSEKTERAKRSKRVIYDTDPSVEWYTPRAVRALASSLLGPIDLDPATCPENPLAARRYFTAADGPPSVERWRKALTDALPSHHGPTLWLNPPYGRETGGWLELLAQLHESIPVTSLVLVPARPGTLWYKAATGAQGADLVCEIDGRLTFDTRNPEGLIVAGKDPARWACVLLFRAGRHATAHELTYVRRALARFGEVRLSGRTRRAHAGSRDGIYGPARMLRPRGPRDERQLAFEVGGSWPTNVVPIQQPRTKGTQKP